MLDWTAIGIISIIFNIILALLFYFKSALNEILKNWWFERKKKKEKVVNRLIEFKTKFNILQSHNFLVIIMLAQKQAALIMKRSVEQFIEDTYQSSLKKSEEARNSISAFMDFLPEDLRGCFSRYYGQFIETIRNIMNNRITKENVMSYSDKMASLALECTNLVDSKIRKHLD